MAIRTQAATRALSRATSTLLDGWGGLLERVAAQIGDLTRVTRYLQGRLEFVPRDDDIYVVSYPRSGTTWMQLALYLLTTDGSMDFEHISQVVPWFERALAVGAATAADFDRMRSPRVFKSHLPRSWLPDRGRYIYMQRDGMDVAVSYYHFYCSHLGFDGSFERFFDRFLRGELQYRSWFKHVAGWRAERGNPRVLIVDYEQLKADMVGCLEQVADFCQIAVDHGRLEEVAEGCSFEQMKRRETQFDHATDILLQRGIRRGAFIRRGRVGDGRAMLSEQQRKAFSRLASRAPRLCRIEARLPDFLH